MEPEDLKTSSCGGPISLWSIQNKNMVFQETLFSGLIKDAIRLAFALDPSYLPIVR